MTSLSRVFARLLPESRRASALILELVREGQFLTYGIGVSLSELADPTASLGHVPVS